MKPVSLRLENFRSYRNCEPIEFGDAALVAVVGPTGAGKSSILEAMIYALYGERSDSKQKQDELIAFNERAMAVTFNFSIHGQTYEIYRSRRNGLAVQKLTLPSGTSYVNMSEVDEQVEAVLGLSKDAFLKTVLLPQGRFAELLLDTGGNRAKILAQVLGLNYFDALNANAKLERERAGVVKIVAEGSRKMLPEKPAADVADAATKLTAARATVTKLDTLREQYAQTQAALAAREAGIRDVDAMLDRLKTIDTFKLGLSVVRVQVKGLGPGLTSATETLTVAEAHRVKCEGAVRTRREAGLDLTTISTAREQLSRLQLVRTERKGEEERHNADTKSLEAKRKEVRRAETRKSDADKNLKPLLLAKQTAEATLTTSTAAARALSDLNTEQKRRAGVMHDERAVLAKNASAVKIAEETERTAAAALKTARAAVTQAREAVSTAERTNAAAFLGSHLHPGDNCPVCSSKVPKSFVARASQDVAVAQGLLKKAESAERDIGTKHTAAHANLQSARDLVTQQTRRVAKAESELIAIDEQISAICVGVPVKKKVEDLNDAVTGANSAAEAARRKVSEGEKEIARTKQALDGEREQLTILEGKVKATKSALDRRDKAIGELIKALPQLWLPDEKSTVDILLGKLEKERVRSEMVEDDYRKAQEAKTTISDEMTRLEREFEKLVNRPLQSLRDQATAYARDLGHTLPLPDFAADNPYFDTLLEVAAARIATLRDKRLELTGQRSEVEARRNALVEAAGGDIPGRHALALVEVGQLEERLQTLNDLVLQVAAVEQTIAAVIPIHAALDAIAKATAANQFPEFLTNQYVARLLTIGSDYFMEMTERFRFVLPNFEGRAADKELRILDVRAGATMPPQNLSGGEKFLASLALSLAVVDQAALAGAKIDSLFLDEGFASLDSTALDKAMMELRARARKGRSIWVITHLRDVARYAERTYRVEKGPNGSAIALNDGDIEEPIDMQGLLTALT